MKSQVWIAGGGRIGLRLPDDDPEEEPETLTRLEAQELAQALAVHVGLLHAKEQVGIAGRNLVQKLTGKLVQRRKKAAKRG